MLIFLIESDNLLQETLTEHLAKLDHQTVPLASLEDFLQLVDGSRVIPDLIVAEIGIIEQAVQTLEADELSRIQSLINGVSIIVLTSNRNVLPTQAAVSSGVFGYLHTPFSLSELELMLIRISNTQSADTHSNLSINGSGRTLLRNITRIEA